MNIRSVSIRCSLLALLSTVPIAVCAASEADSINLPMRLGSWTRPDTVRQILPGKMFDYMDGAAEIYLGYRFKQLDVAEYSAPGEEQILVELFWMESSDDAFGLLSRDWSGEPVEMGAGMAQEGRSTWLPPGRARYGAGLLRIWSDNLYVRIMAYRENARSKEAVLTLARTIAAGRKNRPAPGLLEALPHDLVPGFKLRPDRTCYFRSHLVLNSVYALSPKNILDLGRSVEAVTASYASDRGARDRQPVQLIMVRYADDAAAQKALSHFEQAYLAGKKPVSGDPAPGTSRYWQVADSWMGYGQSGRTLVIVFECPDRATAGRFVDDSIGRPNRTQADEPMKGS